MSAVVYIGTRARGGLYRRADGATERLERLSRHLLPARFVRLLFARAILCDQLVSVPTGAPVEAFADELLADVELGGLFSLDADAVASWLELRGLAQR